MRMTTKTKSILIGLIFLLVGAFASGDVKSIVYKIVGHIPTVHLPSHTGAADAVIQLPSSKYPETVKHIRDAIKAGKSDVCTIDRNGAEQNRKQSLKGVPTKKGYDRDEYPMAMCAEGGAGADIRYVTPRDNRGAGSWIANQLDAYPDGTRVRFQ